MTEPVAAGQRSSVDRPSARIGIISQGTSEFDSRTVRIARTCAARGDTVTVYARHAEGLPAEEHVDGYRIVRVALNRADQKKARARASGRATSGRRTGQTRSRGPVARVVARGSAIARRLVGRVTAVIGSVLEHTETWRRFQRFPIRPVGWARWYEAQVEPHDIWHGMWAGSLPTIDRLRRRLGGATVYDTRDVYLRSRGFDGMPRWQRWALTRIESRWARRQGAVLQVSEPYAEMTARDLGLRDVPVVRNCPDRWDPPDPRPDRIRETLGLSPATRVVLYQGMLLSGRGIEQSMDAILQVPDAVLVLMGFVDHTGRAKESAFHGQTRSAPYAGRVHVIDPVPPGELLGWSASADVMVMCYQPNSENHAYVTPQKLWEAMAAGVPVVASDLPGFRSVVPGAGCGVLVDPTDPAAIAAGITELLDRGPEGLRATGERGRAAAHATYNWEEQMRVLDGVYGRLLAGRGGS
ncbi:MAG: glycosyltransferase [Chloroflexi bacterium]|nr:glycosyltransferase [Chloroflexota bacterium]